MFSVAAAPNDCSTTTSPLLKLPGELRNRIYRALLVSDSHILTNTSGIPEPPLLLASQQIRNEAITIYYNENKFTIPIPDYSSDIFLAVTQRVEQLRTRYKIAPWTVCTSPQPSLPNWSNVMQWLKRYHSGLITGVIDSPEQLLKLWSERLTSDLVIAGMFCMVDSMKGKAAWEETEKLLGHQRVILARLDKRWGE